MTLFYFWLNILISISRFVKNHSNVTPILSYTCAKLLKLLEMGLSTLDVQVVHILTIHEYVPFVGRCLGVGFRCVVMERGKKTFCLVCHVVHAIQL